MENIFKKVFMSMSDDELKKAIQEIEKSRIDEFYEEDSIVRNKARELKQEFGSTSLDLMFSEVNILRVVSLKWLESNKNSTLEVLNITLCDECNFCSTKIIDGLDTWEYFCSKKNSKLIAHNVDWIEKVEIPNWCPLK